jgi:hypothetical protein
LFNSNLDGYDIIANLLNYVNSGAPTGWDVESFRNSTFGWWCDSYSFGENKGYFPVTSAPNLSIFPLLAYQKIYYDHYIYRQWQPYRSYACNIDYLQPSDSMNFASKLPSAPYKAAIFDLHSSNLPLDYFNGVLPRAQYSDEGAATVDVSNISIKDPRLTLATSVGTPSGSHLPVGVTSFSQPGDGTANIEGNLSTASTSSGIPINPVQNIKGKISANSSLKVSALRSAIALQQ